MAAAEAMLDDRRFLAMSQRDDDISIQQFLSWLKTNRNFSSAYRDAEKPIAFNLIPPIKEYPKKDNYKKLLDILTVLFRPEDPPHLAEEIVQNCTAVFSILLYIGKGKYIGRFFEHSSLSDLKLPFNPDAPPARFPQSTADSKFFERFCQQQWRFCCLTLHPHCLQNEYFHAERVLPIVRRQKLGSGASANLYRIENSFQTVDSHDNGEDILKFWERMFDLVIALTDVRRVKHHGLLNGSPVLQGLHQDVKPDNILVFSGGLGSPYKWQFMLGDFGLSQFQKVMSSDEGAAIDAQGTCTNGAPDCYRADDVLTRALLLVKPSVDIWSLGCICTEAARWVTNGKKRLEFYRQKVTAIAFSPDDKLSVSSSYDKTVSLWDTVSGARLDGHSDGVSDMAFSPDRKIGASAGDTTVRLWDVVTGAALHMLDGHSNGVRALINNRVARSTTSLWTIWQAQFSLPGLSYLIRRTGSLSLKRLLALSICFANPVLADVPGSGSSDSNWHNISSLIKHMDQLLSYGIKLPFSDIIGTPSSSTFGSVCLIYCSVALVCHRFHKDDRYQNQFLVAGIFCGLLITMASTNGAGWWGPFLVYVPSCVSITLAISAVLHRAIAKRQAQPSEKSGRLFNNN